MLAKILKSESIRSAIGFGAGGVGFALGNIVLAKVLSPASFGVVSLALALNQFGLTFGPFGLEVVGNRHRPRVGKRLASMALSAASVTGVLVAFVAAFYYELPRPVVFMLFAMVLGSATNRVCVSLFQGDHKMRAAMLLSQVHNYVLLFAAALAILLSEPNASFVVGVMTLSYLVSATAGWWVARRSVNEGRSEIRMAVALKEGASAIGIGVAVQILMQFERFAIPKVATIELLATYAVLAAVVGSPFRMIQIGATFILMPRLRAAADRGVARNLLVREAATALLVSALSIAAIVLVSPIVFKTILNSKYAIDRTLILATVVVGLMKVWEGFSTTVVSACGSSRALAGMSVLAWICLGIAAALMPLAARFGLAGIIYGVGVAWFILCCGGTALAARSFRAHFGERRLKPRA